MAEPDFKSLREALSSLVKAEGSLRLLAERAGVPPDRFPAGLSTLGEVIDRLLRDAHLHSPATFESLLDEVLQEFPGNEVVRVAWREARLHQAVEFRPDDPDATMSTDWGAPAQVPIHWGAYHLKRKVEEAEGALGLVYVARPALARSAQEVALPSPEIAVKILKPYKTSEKARRSFQREVQALTAIRHPHVVSIHRGGEHKDRGGHALPYIEMEYIPEGSLSLALHLRAERRTTLDPESALRAWLGLVSAVRCLHEEHHLLHCDIKPSNILVHRGVWKLADFGTAFYAREALRGQALGSRWYKAPELVAEGGAPSEVSDLFSLGVVLWTALSTHWPPRPAPPGAEAVLDIAQVEMHPDFAPLHPTLQRLLRGLLQRAPDQRTPSALELERRAKRTLEKLILTPHQRRWESEKAQALELAHAEHSEQFRRHQATVQALQEEALQARTEVEGVKGLLSEADRAWRQRLEGLQRELTETSRQLATAANAHQLRDSALADREREMRALKANLDGTRLSLSTLRAERDQRTAEVEKVEELLREERRAHDWTQRKHDEAAQALMEERAAHATTRAERGELRVALAREHRSHTETLAGLREAHRRRNIAAGALLFATALASALANQYCGRPDAAHPDQTEPTQAPLHATSGCPDG